MAGVPPRLQARVPVPLLDGVTCAVLQAQLLVTLDAVKPRTGSLAALPARELVGVSAALAARFRPPLNTSTPLRRQPKEPGR